MAQFEVTLAGFGGQGIMTAGQLLAYTGIEEKKQVVWLPSYGPEMRGGTAYCTVVISDTRIGSPIINNPTAACVFNRPSFDKFSPRVKPGGLLLVNSSLIDVTTDRTDITELLIPANKIALDAGNARVANIVILGAFIGASKIVSYEKTVEVIRSKLGRKKEMLDINLNVLEKGFKLALDIMKKAGKKEKA
ncbi:MAG: 2-oxoacid:acceptor oxidoreductase family protein [candidate division Zixibacteria bacterium]|nr:2-oxoacid:acceptor oxidoreductase family protein [candidate division Zixibacteria bacterium]